MGQHFREKKPHLVNWDIVCMANIEKRKRRGWGGVGLALRIHLFSILLFWANVARDLPKKGSQC